MKPRERKRSEGRETTKGGTTQSISIASSHECPLTAVDFEKEEEMQEVPLTEGADRDRGPIEEEEEKVEVEVEGVEVDFDATSLGRFASGSC